MLSSLANQEKQKLNTNKPYATTLGTSGGARIILEPGNNFFLASISQIRKMQQNRKKPAKHE